MPLCGVTITGVDDRINLGWLEDYSEEFPFVEWGVLASPKNGRPRYPSPSTIRDLLRRKERADPNLRLSLHICGLWMRTLLLGQIDLPTDLTDGFDRLQLNTGSLPAAIQYEVDGPRFADALRILCREGRPVILPVDEKDGNAYVQKIYDDDPRDGAGCHILGLTDASGGRGVLPRQWPSPFWMDDDVHYRYHGYAGGLTVENLAEQLPLIEQASKGARYWIDVESGVRSNISGSDFFDILRVREFLKIASPHVVKV